MKLKWRLNFLLGEKPEAEQIGYYGETLTVQMLHLSRILGKQGKVLRNIYIPKDNGETSEIDVLFLTQKGIFVIESKNYSGRITGDERELYWTASLSNGEENTFYNPMKQNDMHIKWLAQFLGEDVPMFSVIVFSDRCELRKIILVNPETEVIHRYELYRIIRKIWSKTEDALDQQRIDALYQKLKPLTNADDATKEAHISSIQQKLHQTQEELICPLCGSMLVLRTARRGVHAGNQFYGCSGFPACRYIKNI